MTPEQLAVRALKNKEYMARRRREAREVAGLPPARFYSPKGSGPRTRAEKTAYARAWRARKALELAREGMPVDVSLVVRTVPNSVFALGGMGALPPCKRSEAEPARSTGSRHLRTLDAAPVARLPRG